MLNHHPMPCVASLRRVGWAGRLRSFLASGVAVLAATRVLGVEDVPEGGFRWIQGYDGNAPTQGFRVDGLLRIEAPDEPQPVGIHLESGKVEVGASGEIQVRYGPGGSRFILGDVVNDGLISLKSSLAFSRDGAEWVNRGVIEAVNDVGLGITGKDAVFRQVSGEIRLADPSQRLEFHNRSRFIYQGGKVSGRPVLIGASAEVQAEGTQALALQFLGEGSSLEGRFPEDLSVLVASDDAHGPGSLALNTPGPIEGLLELVAGSASSGAVLELPRDGATLGARGVLRVKPGAGLAEIRGRLALEGWLDVPGSARWTTRGESLTNRGRIRLPFGGRLQAAATMVQAGGTLQILGGQLELARGLSVDGGTLVASGTIAGSLTNGALAVVDQEQPGRVRGDWTQTSSGTLRVRVLETSPLAEPALQVTGPVSLRGTLEVMVADGVQLSQGAELRLVQASRIEGWFDRLELPTLEAGLHWRVVPSDGEVRLAVQDAPPPLLLEWLQGDLSDRIRVSGPWTPEMQLVVHVSRDLKHWTPFAGLDPFVGLAQFPVPRADDPSQVGTTVYQAFLIPLSAASAARSGP